MTQKEFSILASAIKTYYPRDNILPTKEAAELWYEMLKDLDYDTASMALKRHVATSHFPPTIADIREKAQVQTDDLSESQAWAMVANALRNGIYHSQEEFDKFPPTVQRAVGQPSQLEHWAMDGEFNEEVAKSNFLRCYRTELARESEMARLPENVRVMIETTKQKLLSP